MIAITDTLPPADKLAALVAEANDSPFIGSLSVDELLHLMRGGTIRFITLDGVLVGFGGWIPINAAWVEAGPFFVSERARGRGLGKRIVQEVVAQGEQVVANQYAVTRNPAMRHMLTDEGFQEVRLFSLPTAVLWFVLRKVTLAKVLQFIRKRSPEPVRHFVRVRQ